MCFPPVASRSLVGDATVVRRQEPVELLTQSEHPDDDMFSSSPQQRMGEDGPQDGVSEVRPGSSYWPCGYWVLSLISVLNALDHFERWSLEKDY